jgi:hypothetical protein
MVAQSTNRDAVSVIPEFCRCGETSLQPVMEEETKLKIGEKFKLDRY